MAKNNSKKAPLGDRIRDMINPALEDSRPQKMQLDLLDNFFKQVAFSFSRNMESTFSDVFNHVSSLRPQEKNPFLIDALTKGKYTPVMRLPVPLALQFTSFSTDEIRTLPAYVMLHEVLRAENIAIKVIGLTANEVRSSGGLSSAIVIIDASKSYNDGALENSGLYPDLPPPPPDLSPPPPDAGGSFNF